MRQANLYAPYAKIFTLSKHPGMLHTYVFIYQEEEEEEEIAMPPRDSDEITLAKLRERLLF